jgi:DNA mismatch endonuclease (patch repair protein)
VIDTLTKEQRSEIMRRVGRENTKPELAVRSVAHALGYRYRLHCKKLFGSPDIVFTRKRKAIFVHGCFWHGHENCRLARTPKNNSEYWIQKVIKNKERDRRVIRDLSEIGWTILVIWECETRNRSDLAAILSDFLGPPRLK